MLAVQWLSPCAAMAEVANEGRVLRVLFLADFVQTGNEYADFSPHCDVCLLAAPSLTSTSVHGKRTLGIHSTVRLLALSGVHHVESCQVEETVLLSPSLCVVPYSTNPALTSWAIRIVGGENLVCFSCPKGPSPTARHHVLAKTPALRQTVAGEDANQVLVVPIPKPYPLYLSAIVDNFPKTSVENTLPQSYLDALDVLGEPKSSAPASRLVFVLAHEQGLFAHKAKLVTDFFHPVLGAPGGAVAGDRIWLEGGREMEQLARVVSQFVGAKAAINGLEISWPIAQGEGKVCVLGRDWFRVECLDDLALGKRLAQHLNSAPDLFALVDKEEEEVVAPKRARLVEEPARTDVDPDAQPLHDFLLLSPTKETLLSDAAHEGSLGDKKQLILLVKRFPALFSLDLNPTGKRTIKLIMRQ